MHVITIANNKGGVGKTTLAFNLAKNYLRNNRKVVAIDFDQQGNLGRLLPDVTRSDVKAEEVQDLIANYVVVDTGPTFVMDHITLMCESDLVLVPFLLERMDLEQTRSLLNTINKIGASKKAKLIAIHGGKHTSMYKTLKPFLKEMCEEFGVEVISEFRRSQAVSQANLIHKTVFEINSPPEVRQEFKDFYKAVGVFLGSLNKQHVDPRELEKEIQNAQV